MLKTRRGSPQWVLHLANCSLFCHQNPERQKDRYLCLKRSPPWRSSAFSRLSIAILQVRFAFLHEVWLLELEGSCVSFCWCHQAVSSIHSRSSFQPGSKEGHQSLAQGPSPPPPHHFLHLVAPAAAPAQAPTPLVWILEAVSELFSYCPLTVPLPQDSHREQPGHSMPLFTAHNGSRLQGNIPTSQRGTRGPFKVISYTLLPCLVCSLVLFLENHDSLIFV